MMFALGTVGAVNLPLAFFFDDPEDDREEAIEDAGEWSESDLVTVNRPGFTLQYPKDWRLATNQADYKPDSLFTIETPGSSHIVIEIFDAAPGMDVSGAMDDVLQALDGPAVETYSYGSFETWGNYKGVGKHLKGKIMSMIPGGCRVFAAVVPGTNKGILITEFYMSEDLPVALPGYDLISRTLVFK
ncbi:hypothetical protein [Cerasicoccus arenae]|uniref:Uncharacterized protein n=2 Tax=Cerasicoccus arenae TaxID=424488 RepID=A0A8J3GEJ8_9BACT|nr:hypothetical protein [Cerasicoccus arenae]GHC04406.1 hypothetical protein GCM10007047_21420 [Cerasicoccus arenae]